MGEMLTFLADRRKDSPFIYIVTPNVDHVVKLHNDCPTGDALRYAYGNAAFRLCDSRVLSALALLHNIRLPVVPGSDLVANLFENVISAGDVIAIVGGTEETLSVLQAKYPHVEFFQHIPPLGLRDNPAALAAAVNFVVATKARFQFLAVGAPQQEIIAEMVHKVGCATGVGLCVGASIDFLTGAARRAPRPFQRMTLEWLHRLAADPRRMWRRYLVEGPKIFLIVAKWRPDA